MYAAQDKLPNLPLPTVAETAQRYLEQVRPLVSDAVYNEAVSNVKAFEGSAVAQRLQQQLLEHRARDPNWLSRLWSDAYLLDRDPPGLHVSPSLGFDPALVAVPLQRCQLRVAAAACLVALQMQDEISQRTLAVDTVRGQPLCMDDYENFMGNTRIPNIGRDIVVKSAPRSRYWHCAVICRGHLFELPLATPTWSADVDGLVHALGGIRRVASQKAAPSLVPALTYLHRDDWAGVRSRLMTSAPHRLALHRIESALFVLTLDDLSPADDSADFMHGMMHGNTAQQAAAGDVTHHNRWWDKSLHLHVARNGAAGLTFEHSAMDSLPVLNFARRMAAFVEKIAKHDDAAEGKVKDCLAPRPRELVFPLDGDAYRDVAAAVGRGVSRLRATLKSINIASIATAFPTAKLRAHGLSPDGTAQACLDVAFRATRGVAPSTYESAATKTFVNGRTETLRPTTASMSKFASLFAAGGGDAKPDAAAIIEVLRAVSKQHNALARAASAGHGCDRHLLGLAAAAEELGVPMPSFLTDAAFKAFKTITLSTTHPFWSKGSRCVCFGPVISPLCIGAGYFVMPSEIVIGVSTWRSSASDDASQRFQRTFDAVLAMVTDAVTRVTPPPSAKKKEAAKSKL